MPYMSGKYVKIYGFAGSKGSGKDTLARAVASHTNKFLIYHFADRLKDICHEMFSIPRNNFDDVDLKESPLAGGDLALDDHIYKISRCTGLNIKPHGLIAKTHRELLQFVGTDYVRSEHDNYWVDYLIQKIESLPSHKKKVIIADVRFQNEVDAVRSIGGTVFRITRENWATSGTHGSELGNYDQDYTFYFRQGDLSIFDALVPRLAHGREKFFNLFDYTVMKPVIDRLNNGELTIYEASELVGYKHHGLSVPKNIFKICANYFGCQVIKKRPISGRIKHKIIDGSELKTCGVCKVDLKLVNFNNHKRAWDGLFSICKGCKAKSWKVERKQDFISVVRDTVKQARYRKKEFSLTIEDVTAIYHKQNGLCYYTNKPMDFIYGSNDKLSLDRVDSSKGYTLGNVVLCRKYVNIAKSNHTIEDFYNLACDVKSGIESGKLL